MKSYKSIDMRLYAIDEARRILVENNDLSFGQCFFEIFRPSNFTNPKHTISDIAFLKHLSTNDIYHAVTIAKRKLKDECEEIEQRKEEDKR